MPGNKNLALWDFLLQLLLPQLYPFWVFTISPITWWRELCLGSQELEKMSQSPQDRSVSHFLTQSGIAALLSTLNFKNQKWKIYHPSVKCIWLPPWGRSNSQDAEVGNAVKCDKPEGHADHCDAFDLILDVGRLRKLSFSSWPKFFNSLWNANRVSNLGWSHLHQESREDPGYYIFIINSWDCFKIGNLDHSFHQHHHQNQNTYFL